MFPALTFTVYRASQNVTAFTSMARGEKPQGARLLAKKPIMMLRRWQVASAAAAKPGEAMARHKAVKPVPPSQGQQPRNPRNAPWETQAFSHSYLALRLEPNRPVSHRDIALKVFGIHAVVGVDGLAQRTLRRQQAIGFGIVMLHNKVNLTRAQRAVAIKHNDGLVICKMGHARVFFVAVGGVGQHFLVGALAARSFGLTLSAARQ